MPASIPRHSREVTEIVEALDARLADADNVIEKAWDKVTPDELTYIDAELERVLTDRRYYLENYHVITDENGRLQTLYPFWDHQEIIFAQLQKEWDANGRFRGIILKPRQCGGTVWSAGVIFHSTIFTPQAFSLMMAHDDEASAEIDRRVRVAHDNLPWWMRPDILSRQAERHWIFQRASAEQRMSDPGLGSTLLISNAQRKAGIAIGRTVRSAHFSEVSRWPDASIYTADIKPSMNARDILAIMESTAYGRNGLFFNQWNAAEKGKSVWTPIFIPVYRVRKYYLPLTPGQKFTLTPEEKASKLAVKQKEDFTIPNSFFNWRRQDILETINSTGSDEDHYEAYPMTSIEAFISSGFCAFPKKSLNHQARANCCAPIAIGEIEYVGPDAEPILRLHPPTDEELLEKPDRVNRLWLWEYPDANEAVEYYGSGDVAGGSGPDFSDGTFYRLPCGPHDKMTQVAEWHGLCNPSHFARIMAALGYWYHTAELAIEYMKAGITTGDELLHQLDYPNLYRWKHMDKISNTMTLHVHWMTTSRTRDDAINRMNERLLDDTIVIRNKHTIEEMRDFGRLEGDGKAEGLDNNDDMVMCFPDGVLITTGKGKVPIQEVAQGDAVLCHDGLWRRVEAYGKRRAFLGEGLVSIQVWGLAEPIRSTPSHPILIRKRKASCPVRFDDMHWVRAETVTTGDAVFVPVPPRLNPLPLTESELYLLGWYLADGSLSKGSNTVTFKFGADEAACAGLVASIASQIVGCHPTYWRAGVGCQAQLSRNTGVAVEDHGNYISVTASNRWLAKWIRYWVGESGRKKIHPRIVRAYGTIPLAVGFLEGDGSQKNPRRALSVCQKNHVILWDIREILMGHGVWAPIAPAKDKRSNQLIMNIGAPWVNKLLSLYPGALYSPVKRILDHPIARWEGNGFWVTVRSLSREVYTGEVHNLSVEDAHSYVAGEIAVHNSNVINICAAHQSGRESSEPASSSSAHSHLFPRTPRVWGIYDHLMRQIDQLDSEDQVKKVIENAAKKYNGRVEDVLGKRNLSDSAVSAIGWAVKLPNQMLVVSAREIQVMQANTPYSPIHDANGAEHDLHYKHGIPAREMMPEVVQLYRAILTAQHYEGDD